MYIYVCVLYIYIYIYVCIYIYICLYTLLAFVYQHDLSPHHVFSRILLFQLWGLPYINIWEQLIIIANTLRSFNIAMEAMAHRKRWFMTIYLLRMVISRGYVKLPEHVHIYIYIIQRNWSSWETLTGNHLGMDGWSLDESILDGEDLLYHLVMTNIAMEKHHL